MAIPVKREKRDRRLWHRVEGYSFHERPLSRSLVEQLEEVTGHPTSVCYVVIEEYRRFMYLLGSTGESLSPSPIVAVVWRLHVKDKKAYYEDFCPRILGRTIDYPNDLPPTQDDPGYERTLEFYAEEFGWPDVQYWPDPDHGSVNTSTALLWILGFTAFALSIIFGSLLFALFGAVVIIGAAVLRWRYASLPLHNISPEGGNGGRSI